MKKFVLILLCLGLVNINYSKTFTQKIEEEKKTGRISEIDALYYEGLRLLNPALLPDVYRQYADQIVKCGFGVANAIRQNRDNFSAEQKENLTSFFYRPTASYTHLSPSGRFTIHYNLTGSGAVSPEDKDGSGVPDYVEEAAISIDYCYTVEIEQMGFKEPPPDPRDGPTWDVYIKNMPNTYGQTNWYTKISENPRVWTSYMEVDNDFTHTKTKGLDGLRVTLAHEFFHMIQLGTHARDDDHNGSLDDMFYMEVSSTWMEDAVYDNINDYYYYLPSFYRSTNTSFNNKDGIHEYALSIWLHFLVKRFESYYQGGEIVKRIWDEIINYPAIEATDIVLKELNSSFDNELTTFYGWNYLTGSNADTVDYYPEGNYYPDIDPDQSVDFESNISLIEDINPMAAKYIQFNRDDSTTFTLVPTNINRTLADTKGKCTISMLLDQVDPRYVDLGYDARVNIVTDDKPGWKCAAIVQSPGQTTQFIQFDENKIVPGSIGGFVWEDLNANDSLDDLSEMGFSDVTVNLTGAGSDSTLNTKDDINFILQTTNFAGWYSFSGLLPGLYRVGVNVLTLPDGYIPTGLNDPKDLSLSEGETIDDVNFGYKQPDEEDLPESIPNPFSIRKHTEVVLPFDLKNPGIIKVAIFNASGFKMKEEEEKYYRDQGIKLYRWDGKDESGVEVPSGIYIYLVSSEDKIIRKEKFAVIR
jgi:hypothetical protein